MLTSHSFLSSPVHQTDIFCQWEHSLFKVTDAAVCALPLAVDTVSWGRKKCQPLHQILRKLRWLKCHPLLFCSRFMYSFYARWSPIPLSALAPYVLNTLQDNVVSFVTSSVLFIAHLRELVIFNEIQETGCLRHYNNVLFQTLFYCWSVWNDKENVFSKILCISRVNEVHVFPAAFQDMSLNCFPVRVSEIFTVNN